MAALTDTIIKEKTKLVIKQPSKYKAIFINDDKTTMEFVIELLITVFGHTAASAIQVMMETHHSGSGVAKVYNSYEIAEQEVEEAISISRSHGYPLQIKVEEER